MEKQNRNKNDKVSNRKPDNRKPDNKKSSSGSVKNKKVKKNNNSQVIAFIVVFSIMLLLYFAGSLYKFYTREEVEYIVLQKSTISVPNTYSGIITRDETVYNSSNDGDIEYYIRNGERAKKNELVAVIVNQSNVDSYETEISNINDEILKNEEFRGDQGMFTSEINKVNELIKQEIYNKNYKSFADAYVLKENLDESIGLRNQMLLSQERNANTSTVNDKVYYQQKINEATAKFNALHSGIVYYGMDGFEETLTPSNISEITENQTKMDVKLNKPSYDKAVYAGDQVFKIVNDNTWYITLYVGNDDVNKNKLIQGGYKKIYVQNELDYIELNAIVETIESDGKDSKVVFKINDNIVEFLQYRTVSLKLDKDIYEGIKIPKKCVVQKEILNVDNYFVFEDELTGGSYVYKKQYDGTALRIDINPYRKDENVSKIIAEQTVLTSGDVLLSNDNVDIATIYQIPKKETINGVLVINTGVASFREIYVNEELQDGEYVILNPTINNNVRVMDKVAIDTVNVIEGQIVN